MPTGLNYCPNENHRVVVIIGLRLGVSQARIAQDIRISIPTLSRHYKAEIDASALKRGRKTFQPTEEQRRLVLEAAKAGGKHADIAVLVGVSPGTLREHFLEELRLGRAWANLKVGATLFRIATAWPPLKGTPAACIFWAKTRMGWRTIGPVSHPNEFSQWPPLVIYDPNNPPNRMSNTRDPDPTDLPEDPASAIEELVRADEGRTEPVEYDSTA
jgi:hypothetical protein